jgi:2-phosphosulfolactate phosphatase
LNVRIYYHTSSIDELALRDANVVVIDVLRATTTIVHAMAAGAKEIIPVGNADQAMRIAGSLFSTTSLLCGERGGRPIEGGKLGNSPKEYTAEVIEGKSLILMTTNGAPTLVKARYAKRCYIAAFANISAVALAIKAIPNIEHDGLAILCSGREGDFSLEDALCAGLLVERLIVTGSEIRLSDTVRVATSLWHEYHADLVGAMKSSDHGKHLISIGYEKDIEDCAAIDTIPIVPVLEQTRITKKIVLD